MEQNQTTNVFTAENMPTITKLIYKFVNLNYSAIMKLYKGSIEDFVQDCFVRAIKYQKDFDKERGALSTWIFHVCETELIAKYKYEKTDRRAVNSSTVSIEENDIIKYLSSSDDVEKEVQDKLFNDYMKENFFDADTREGYIVRRISQGASTQKIANELGLNRKQVWHILWLIRANIAEEAERQGKLIQSASLREYQYRFRKAKEREARRKAKEMQKQSVVQDEGGNDESSGKQ